MDSPPLVIRWSESDSPRYHWFIRGLRPDGSFYGEVRSTFDAQRESDGAAGVSRAIESQLTVSDMKTVSQLAATIRKKPSADTDRPVIGVLADGPINDPVMLYRHTNSACNSPVPQSFLAIIAILRPHLTIHYPTLA